MIATIALLAWPVIALILFTVMSPQRATVWTILGGYLLLPAGVILVDLPGMPELDKSNIPSIAALLLAPLLAKKGDFRWPRGFVINTLIIVWLLVPFATSVGNGAPIITELSIRPGMAIWDALSASIHNFLEIIPFILGAGLLANEKGHNDVLKIFVLGALLYAPLVLAEIRFSPFLQNRLYGVTNWSYFMQQIRGDGFRSIAFLGHGLLVSAFIGMAAIGAWGLWKSKTATLKIPAIAVALFLCVVLVLNKSLGAVLLVLIIAPLLLILSQRRFLTVVLAIGTLIALYPMARAMDLLPLHSFVSSLQAKLPERAESFAFRVMNEDLLLARAFEKPVFGWGTFARNRVHSTTEGISRDSNAVTDGTWIIILGRYGWVGYLSYFGILTYPFLRAYKYRKIGVSTATAALSGMLLLNLLDLIPNSSQSPVTWLIAGAIANVSVAKLRVRSNAPPRWAKVDGEVAQAAA